ncbi:AAA family ATPase [Oerskovia sp. Root918]|uniref:AAA family ATPase n=1 Tax=Oerskovia sp. Root918 TaxID=1736607 RepID=UPI000B33D0B5|nr:ATP-binding protein [Oerskovia sp. Root918]
MAAARITELRLTSFKSFRRQTLPIDATTILIGRNGAGKSNALDGLEVLSRLASGDDIRDALDTESRSRDAIRGGSAGCSPHGSNSFEIGCRVVHEGRAFEYDVSIQTSPEVRVLRESLTGPAPAIKSGRIEQRDLIKSQLTSGRSSSINAEIYNGRRGTNPSEAFRDNRLIITQAPIRLSGKNSAERAIQAACSAVTSAMIGIFHLDPIPHLMRSYTPERFSDLQRTGANISAAIGKLRSTDNDTLGRIVALLGSVSDLDLNTIRVVRSDFGDVMMALSEMVGGDEEVTPAREMSDGLLRFTAICTALLTSNRGLDIAETLDPTAAEPGVTLVVEEIENGLHPAQAEHVLNFIREVSAELDTQVLLTTHSPALLNAIKGPLNRSVIVCYRNRETGKSELGRVTSLPGYARAMTLGGLGDVVTSGNLAGPSKTPTDYSDFLDFLGNVE